MTVLVGWNRLGQASQRLMAWSDWLGRQSAWLLVVMTALAAGNVLLRYLGRAIGTNLTSNALLELQWMLYSVVFLLGASAAVARDGHVRVDPLFSRLAPRARAAVDLVGTLSLALPLAAVSLWVTHPGVARSLAIFEGPADPGGVPRWPMKLLLLGCLWALLAQLAARLVVLLPQQLAAADEPAGARRQVAAIWGAAFTQLALLALVYTFAPLSWLGPLLFLWALVLVFSGFPVAFCLGGGALIFAWIGVEQWLFDWTLLLALPERTYGLMSNQVLLAVPFFVLMGSILERARLADELLTTMGRLLGGLPGGLGLAVVVVGALLAAATGVVGASVVAMGLISLPVMLRYGYDRGLSAGLICASGTLGQIIPPSVVLVVLGDQAGVSVGDLFRGALVPGLMLTGLYALFVAGVAWRFPHLAPPLPSGERIHLDRQGGEIVARALAPPLLLITLVLGSILAGLATPTEAGAVGAAGALLLALVRGRLSWGSLSEAVDSTARLCSMVSFLLYGSTLFALVFRGLDGDLWVEDLFRALPAGALALVLGTNLVVFLLGFFVDFFEICFIVLPLVLPVAKVLGVDLVWFCILLAVNLQTSFLTPPFGFALFYLRGVRPDLSTETLYRGVIPFILLQLLVLGLIFAFPELLLR